MSDDTANIPPRRDEPKRPVVRHSSFADEVLRDLHLRAGFNVEDNDDQRRYAEAMQFLVSRMEVRARYQARRAAVIVGAIGVLGTGAINLSIPGVWAWLIAHWP